MPHREKGSPAGLALPAPLGRLFAGPTGKASNITSAGGDGPAILDQIYFLDLEGAVEAASAMEQETGPITPGISGWKAEGMGGLGMEGGGFMVLLPQISVWMSRDAPAAAPSSKLNRRYFGAGWGQGSEGLAFCENHRSKPRAKFRGKCKFYGTGYGS